MKRLAFILLIVLFICINICSVYAVTIDNNGDIKQVPYGDSKLASSLSGASYVDCYVPYKKTCKEIGGFATSASATGNMVTTGGGSAMPESVQNSPVATTVMEEASYTYAASHGWATNKYANPTGLEVLMESDSKLNVIVDTNGNKYYMTAVQPFFFNHGKAGTDGFPANCSGGFGEIIDVILTDGTCIHFVCFDINAAQHTNGIDTSGAGKFDYVYNNSKLAYPQYNNLFSTQNGNTLELWGDTSRVGVISGAFKKKYNLGSGQGQNRIAYYRMYNKYIKESPKRNSGVGKDVSFSYGNVTIANSDEEGSNSSGSTGAEFVKEKDLIGMPEQSKLLTDQVKIELASRDKLDLGEQYSVSKVGDSLYGSSQVTLLNKARVTVVFVGLLLVFYSVLLFAGYMFDRTNRFFDFSMVGLFTLGSVIYSDDENVSHMRGYVSTGKLFFLIIVVLCVGMLLVFGGVFSVMSEVLYRIVGML